ncbi:MAG: transcriptional repressor [Sphingobacteriales bacterium]|nr:transcriptional repressor [Sphingobacteriales bacterium]
MNEIQKILKTHQLRLTPCREQTLDFFLQQQIALSHADLERWLTAFDRVTLYRTLESFLEKGLIHQVPDDSGTTKYALCSTHCTHHAHHDEHVHFQCTHCGETRCIEQVAIPDIQLPQGFRLQEAKLLVKGICNRC